MSRRAPKPVPEWPALPTTIEGLSGPIRVLRPARTPNQCYGEWDPNERLIRVESVLPRETALRFFLHELTHAAVHDAGLESEIPAHLHESLCGAISSQMMRVCRWLKDASP